MTMPVNNISRNKPVKIARTIECDLGPLNTVEDKVAAYQGLALAEKKKFIQAEALAEAEREDAEWQRVCKIPNDASELMVISKLKKLGAYIIAVTQKSPAKYRGVFVNRMQNFCLDALQDMLNANFIHQDCAENKQRREKFQEEAIIKLKMLSYVAMIAENAGRNKNPSVGIIFCGNIRRGCILYAL